METPLEIENGQLRAENIRLKNQIKRIEEKNIDNDERQSIINCGSVKKKQSVLFKNKIFEITDISNCCKRKMSFLLYDKETKTKYDYIYPKRFDFDINDDGVIVFPDQ